MKRFSMTTILLCLARLTTLAAQIQIPSNDAVRIAEFYRLASQIQDAIWPGWSKVPEPLLLVTPTREFLTRFPKPPAGFTAIGNDFFSRPQQFSTGFLATFPAFG